MGAVATFGSWIGSAFGGGTPPLPQYPPGYNEEMQALRMKYEKIEKEFLESQMKNAQDHTKISRYEKLLQEAQDDQRKLKELQESRLKLERARLAKIGMNHETEFNFAITGLSGTGKSYFCNVLRRVTSDQPDYARVCTGKECTVEAARYPHPDVPHIVLWDIPGGGVADHPSATYFEDHALDLFDVIFVFYDGRFSEVASTILEKAKEYKILDRVAVVYSKTYRDVEILTDDMGISPDDALRYFNKTVSEDFRERSRKFIGSSADSIPMFFICARSWNKNFEQPLYDEPLLLHFMSTRALKRFAGDLGGIFVGTSPQPQAPPGYYDEMKAQRMRYENFEMELKELQMKNAHDHTAIKNNEKWLQDFQRKFNEDQERRLKKARERLAKIGMNHETEINFAIAGISGTGKSYFINVLRRVSYGQPNYARVCTGKECTAKRTRYPHPDIPHAFLWEIPGGGAHDHPSKTYFEDHGLDLFDVILVFHDGRFSEVASTILRKAKEYNILDRVAVVYSKTYRDVENLIDDMGLSPGDALQYFNSTVSKDFRKQSRKLIDSSADSIPMFFICARSWNKNFEHPLYDEPHLLHFMSTRALKRFPEFQV